MRRFLYLFDHIYQSPSEIALATSLNVKLVTLKGDDTVGSVINTGVEGMDYDVEGIVSDTMEAAVIFCDDKHIAAFGYARAVDSEATSLSIHCTDGSFFKVEK